MKRIFPLFFILILIFSCNEDASKKKLTLEETEEKQHMEIHKEIDEISKEYEKFTLKIADLYTESEKNPKLVLSKADSLISIIKEEKDPIKSQIKNESIKGLHYLKGEIFYKLKNYNNSIEELYKFDSNSRFIMSDLAAALAANNLKLKNYNRTKAFIDSIGKNYYIYNYCLANYYESIGDKNEALKIYTKIKNNKTIKHYAYYPWSVKRFEELQKDQPILLNEIYFPTKNPNFEIVDSDDENRRKIFKMISEIPETKEKSIWIFESPQINDKDYYWIKVGESNGFSDNEFKTELNFFIYPKNFEIKFFEEKNNKLMTLKEWREYK